MITRPPSTNIETIGRSAGEVTVSIGPQFLQLFSEQLYSSPNKAFEELVSNAWDAGATAAYIGMPDDLTSSGAAVWVLDNGESMDFAGIDLLWSVAHSTKPQRRDGRPQIGKFGIGKLSTYLLAHQLTYVCSAADGVTRAVTMDYRRISDAGDRKELHIQPLPLQVREVGDGELEQLLADVTERDFVLETIGAGIPQVETGTTSEFGQGDGGVDQVSRSDTWTLAIMTELKPAGQAMEAGRIRRMLRTALPLGESISVSFRGEPLLPTKLDLDVAWGCTLGPDLAMSSLEIARGKDEEPEIVAVTSGAAPYPHLRIDGVPGLITGTVQLFSEPISGGKSSRVAQSNGFFVNILGRVVNPADPYFGLANLNHSAWAKMRAAIRADGLNAYVSVDRDSVNEERPVLIFRAMLRALFNRARSEHDANLAAGWPDAGAVLTKRWGTVPLGPLRRVLSERSEEGTEQPPFILLPDTSTWPPPDDTGPSTDLLEDVLIEALGSDALLVNYDPIARQILVNSDHPFAREYAETHEQQVLLRDSSLVELLTQAFMLDVGVPDGTVAEVASYRDKMLRLVARIRRRSAVQLAELLDGVTSDKDALERALSEALEYLGFLVEFIGGSGEPEGVASAPITPGARGAQRTYTFTYDAKSSKTGRVSNGDVRVSTLVRHREKYEATYTLVVAPDFQEGALYEECARHHVTPMRARDLSALLLLQGTSGPIPFELFREIFSLEHPDDVHSWVEALPSRLNRTPRLSFEDLFDALVTLGYEEPDTLTTSVLARQIRTQTGSGTFPRDTDVARVVGGLSVLIPDLIQATGDRVFLGAEPATIRDVFMRLLARVPERLRFTAPRVAGD